MIVRWGAGSIFRCFLRGSLRGFVVALGFSIVCRCGLSYLRIFRSFVRGLLGA